jgi:hypothetical protein
MRDIDLPFTYEQADTINRPFWDQLPNEVKCTYCGEIASKAEVMGLVLSEPLLNGDPVYRDTSNGEEFRGIKPGAIIDHFDWTHTPDDSPVGKPLKEKDLMKQLPMLPDAQGHQQAHSIYSSNYRNACKAAGVWLPQWIVAVPTDPPEYHLLFQYASNGAQDADGYVSGWDVSGVAPHLTATPSIYHTQSPGGWHGFLTNGILRGA